MKKIYQRIYFGAGVDHVPVQPGAERQTEVDRVPSYKKKPCWAAKDSGTTWPWTKETRIMYITHGTEVVLFQVDSGQKLQSITGLQGVHGVAFAPKSGRGYISNGRARHLDRF